ncbi:hypothetical protein [uncultured Croceitalea sp.]|uniref:hypothetical protein n=1 Tax=uncultured Croceitalea sp. TaxID=1798908 RepID=UPI0033060332
MKHLVTLSIGLLLGSALHSQRIFQNCDSKYGLINAERQILYPAELDDLKYANDNLVGMSNGKYGIIKRSDGSTVLKFDYDKIEYVRHQTNFDDNNKSEVYFISKNGNKANLLNKEGKKLLKKSFTNIEIYIQYPIAYFIAKRKNRYYLLTGQGDYFNNLSYLDIKIRKKISQNILILFNKENVKSVLEDNKIRIFKESDFESNTFSISSNSEVSDEIVFEETITDEPLMSESSKALYQKTIEKLNEFEIYQDTRTNKYGIKKENEILLKPEKYTFLKFYQTSHDKAPLVITRNEKMKYGLENLMGHILLSSEFSQMEIQYPFTLKVTTDCGSVGDFLYKEDGSSILYLPE